MILSTCRFNLLTYKENCDYREKHKIDGCIYGVPMKMRETIMLDTQVFIIEMNNEKNKIEAIGLIKNRLVHEPHYIYKSDGNYNRYIYKGQYRIKREDIEKYNPKYTAILDYILFKEKTHLKRGNGFMRVPDKLLRHWKVEEMDLLEEIKCMFIATFSDCY
jgi:hypothetical protein